ncbi:MAG: hypothetical protein M0R22_02400, partial [Dehalococcoidia bacterium]|nr:hypothetical protein [Dehalococcoidia bacterium]
MRTTNTLHNTEEPVSRADSLQRIGALLAIALGVAIACLNFLHVNAYMLTLGPGLALAGILALATHRHQSQATAEPIGRNALLTIQACFWLLLGVAALIAHSARTERPLSFFVVVAVACALLTLQLCSKPSPTRMVLFLSGAILLSLVVRGSVFYLTPGFPGSDAWGHEQLTQSILAGGHVPADWDSPYYLHYPAMHVTVVMAANLLGVSAKTALFVSVGVPLAFSVLAVVVVARHLVGPTAACVAGLIALFTSYHLQWGTQIIPTSMGLSLFTVAIMLTIGLPRRLPAHALLLLLTAIVLVLCHTVSSFILWTALGALLAGGMVLRGMAHRPPAVSRQHGLAVLLIMLTVIMYIHWSTNPYTPSGATFFEQILLTLRDSLMNDAGFLDRPPEGGVALRQELQAVSSFAMFYFLVAVGALAPRSSRTGTTMTWTIAVAVAALSAFAFAFPLFGIRNIVPHRWFAFIWVLAAPLAAEGLMSLCSLCRQTASAMVAGPATASLLAFLMVTAPISNTDSPVYAADLTQRMTFYESELNGAAWLSSMCAGPFASDLQFGITVLGNHLGLSPVHNEVADHSTLGEYYYLWRSTSLTQPVQLADGREMILGVRHVLEVESQQSAVYSNR